MFWLIAKLALYNIKHRHNMTFVCSRYDKNGLTCLYLLHFYYLCTKEAHNIL